MRVRRHEIQPPLRRADLIDERRDVVPSEFLLREPGDIPGLSAGRRGEILADQQRVRSQVVVEVEDARLREIRVFVAFVVDPCRSRPRVEERAERSGVILEEPVRNAPDKRVWMGIRHVAGGEYKKMEISCIVPAKINFSKLIRIISLVQNIIKSPAVGNNNVCPELG